MTLKDICTGIDWVLMAAAVIFAAVSILMISGKGACLIAGYNTADEKAKQRFDAKKLCRVVGAGFSVITFLLLIMAVWAESLTTAFLYVYIGIVLADCAVMIILANTICKK